MKTLQGQVVSERSKIHHFVPEVLQRQFLDKARKGERIWYAEKKRDSDEFNRPELKTIGKAFQARNFYTTLEDGKLSDRIEKEYYGAVDNYLGKVLPFIHNTFKMGRTPMFNGEQLEQLQQACQMMFKRSPEILADMPTELPTDDVEIGQKYVEETLQTLDPLKDKNRREELEQDKNETAKLRQYGRSIRVNALILKSDLLDGAFAELRPRWAISKGKSSFILSSRITYRIGNGGHNGLSNPDFEMWMPVTPKIALIMTRDRDNRIPQVTIDTPEHMRSVNEYAARDSQQIGSHSRKLIESITGKEAIPPSPNV